MFSIADWNKGSVETIKVPTLPYRPDYLTCAIEDVPFKVEQPVFVQLIEEFGDPIKNVNYSYDQTVYLASTLRAF